MKSCFWTQPEGQAIATSVSTVGFALVMLIAAYMGLVYMRARGKDTASNQENAAATIERQDSKGHAYSAVTGSLNAVLLEDDEGGSMLEAGQPVSHASSTEIPTVLMQPYAHSCQKASTDAVVFAGEASEPERISPWVIILFWCLMLIHVGLMAFGSVSYWDKVHIKGEAGLDNCVYDDSIDEKFQCHAFNIQIYIATFWYNVQQFWFADAKAMAILTAFSGLVQPILQMIAAITIAYAPLTRATRERMLTVQELTCKIPLSSFFVEGFLLEIFSFKLADSVTPLPSLTINLSADVEITGFPALGYFLGGQLLYLLIVNILRNCHRHQGFPDDLHSMHAPAEPRQPSASRPFWRKALLAGLCMLTIAVFALAMTLPFITFSYTGAFADYITTDTFETHVSHHNGTATDGRKMLSRTLFEVCSELVLDMKPESLAAWYSVCAWAVLVVTPMVLVASVLVDVAIPDKMVVSRRWVGEFIEGLQCWVAPEAVVIATIFLGPSIGIITEFVFDTNDVCKKHGIVYEYDGGKECLTVSGRMEGFAMTCLVLYALLCWAIARISVWELKKRHD